jgi:pyruvate,water dikinase
VTARIIVPGDTLRTLPTVRRSDAPECGSKAASLGELASRGYAVPPSLILPTWVYDEFLARNGLQPFVRRCGEEAGTGTPARVFGIEHEVAARFAAAGLSDEVERELQVWMAQFAPGSFAVRSSAIKEDLPGASFAGQYDSFLDVPPSGASRAVVRCFASLLSARAALYRRRKGIAEIGGIAVVVQLMLRSDHAGVVFTRAPRRASALLIECAPGRGDGVVSGTVTPNRYYVNRSTLAVEDAWERHVVDPAAVRATATHALAIERDLGGAQDIEYGVVDDVVHILQARPAGGAPLVPRRGAD